MLNIAAGTKGIAGADTYLINNSLRFRQSASAYLSRTPASAGNRQIYTISFWVKRGSLATGGHQVMVSAAAGSSADRISWQSDNTLAFQLNDGAGGNFNTTQLFRDTSAWYHIVAAIDTTQATSTDRFKLYVNGSQITAFSTATYPSLNYQALGFNNNVLQTIGRYGGSSATIYLDGYLAEINFIDGQALTPSSFGATNADTGIWRPKAYTGTYGTNGYYLNFSNIALTSGSNTGLGQDYSGNGNYFNTTNISVTSGSTYDAMIDSPTSNQVSGTQPVGNYPTMNPLKTFSANMTYSNGNLQVSETGSAQSSAVSTIPFPTTGKWYFECNMVSAPSNTTFVGVIDTATITASASPTITNAGNYRNNGIIYNLAGTSQSGTIATYTTGDVIGVAIDVDAGTVQFYKNNVAQGNTPSFTFTAGTELWASCAQNNAAGTKTYAYNFGQRPFTYTPPTGFKALCSTNLPTPTILQANKYMDATTYTGTGASLSVTNSSSFQPDLVWIKGRSGATDHALYDSTRGTTKDLVSNSTAAETTQAQGVTAFNSNGFTVGTLAKLNTSTATYVAWQWNANNGTTSSNTSGTITSTVQADTSTGFSIVTYTGINANATVGHGLGIAPKMIIVKNRGGATNWTIYHASLGNTQYLQFDTAAAVTDATRWNNTSPTSSVFSLGNAGAVNNVNTYVAYCFAEIAGYSRFGSYTGNGSADGTFVYTGFRPKFILMKSSSVTSTEWEMYDTSRNTGNLVNLQLMAHSSAAESTTTNAAIDLLSNGFKVRSTGTHVNSSGGTYIYAVFAENPFKYTLAR